MSVYKTNPDQLIVVVHGVGDPEPGETLELLARSVAQTDKPLIDRKEAVWLSERTAESDHVETFPVHQRQLEFEDRKIEMCELFWGDLSRVRRGWIGMIQGLFQIVFGLRYVAYVAADQPGRGAYWLKALGLMSSRILHGPVLAVNFYLAILMLAVCGTHVMWPTSYESPLWTQIILAVCAGIAMASSSFGMRATRSRVVERFWFWVNVTTAFVTGLMFIKGLYIDAYHTGLIHECPIHPGLLWYCRVLLVLLGLLWFIEIQVLVVMAGCWLVSIVHPRAYRPALHVAFLLPALAVGIWGQALPLFWVAAKRGIGDIASLPGFSAVFDDAIPFLGVQLIMAAVVLTTSTIVVARYFKWRRTATIGHVESGKRAPRLIVSPALQFVLAVCTFAGVIVVSALCLVQIFVLDYRELAFVEVLFEANKYAIGIVVPLGGLALVLIPKIRPGFDIILDVVNHFYFRPTNLDDALDDDDEFDIAETTFENGTLFFSRRDMIHSRLLKILSHYREAYTHRPELVIVSHSQGTMAAIEVLNDGDIAWLNTSFRNVTLVTMGSPLTHLYQHYFGHCYPALDQPFWSSLRRRIDRWVNICRIDDFVGTSLDFAELTKAKSEFEHGSDFVKSVAYENHLVGPRGHVSYWSDREVLDILKKELISKDKLEAWSAA